MGQTADLMDLQRILLRSNTKLSAAAQQNMTRWAVFAAGTLLRQVCSMVLSGAAHARCYICACTIAHDHYGTILHGLWGQGRARG